jgi:hypothetical protein
MVTVLLNTGAGTVGVVPTGPRPPQALRILAAKPNPSDGALELRFRLPEALPVSVEVFDLAGRKIRSLRSAGDLPAGDQALNWDGRDDRGAPLPGGVYLVRVSAGRDTARQKLVRLR